MPRRKLFIAVLLAGSFAAPAGAAPTLLAPGITYERQVEFTPHGPVVLHVITAPKPDGSLYRLLPVLSNNAIVATQPVTVMEKDLAAQGTAGSTARPPAAVRAPASRRTERCRSHASASTASGEALASAGR